MTAYADQVTADAEDGHVAIAAIADDMEAGFPLAPGKGLPSYLRRQARRLRKALAALEAEGAMLAAGVCEHRLGDDHGNPFCGRTKEPL